MREAQELLGLLEIAPDEQVILIVYNPSKADDGSMQASFVCTDEDPRDVASALRQALQQFLLQAGLVYVKKPGEN